MDDLELVVGTAQADLPEVRGEPDGRDALEEADWGVSDVWGEDKAIVTVSGHPQLTIATCCKTSLAL